MIINIYMRYARTYVASMTALVSTIKSPIKALVSKLLSLYVLFSELSFLGLTKSLVTEKATPPAQKSKAI